MATPRNARLAPVALALIAALASTACQRQSADDASTGAAPDAPAAPVEPAASAAAPEPTMVAPIAFDCGGTAVQASFDGDNATVLIDGETIALATVPAASGARYQGTRADGVAVELWTKGEGATLSVAGNAYPDCTKAASDAAPAQAAYRARGNEPFWSIEASDDELRWTTPDTPDAVVWSGVARTDRADGFDLAATRDGATLTLAATATLCRERVDGHHARRYRGRRASTDAAVHRRRPRERVRGLQPLDVGRCAQRRGPRLRPRREHDDGLPRRRDAGRAGVPRRAVEGDPPRLRRGRQPAAEGRR